MKQRARLLWATAWLLAVGGPAAAESYCVGCYGPDAVYRCVIAGAPENAPADPRHQIQCIKQLAKSGSHTRCSVERFSVEGCVGPERIIDPAKSAMPLAPNATDAAVPPASASQPALATTPPPGGPLPVEKPKSSEPDPAGAAPAPDKDGPPRTVEELAKTTVETTKKSIDDVTGSVKHSTEKAGDQIQGFGSAVGDAAKKSWDCVTSLFSDC
jgi:hypothetical protein